MVGVEHRAAAGDVGDGIDALGFLNLHSDFEPFAVALGGLEAHELRVVLAERLLGLELDAQRVSRKPALERLLQRFEQPAVAAVQIGERLGRRLEQRALRVIDLDAKRYDGVPGNRDRAHARRRFTTSKTSAAWPLGLTP
jgi:hypothetical protein